MLPLDGLPDSADLPLEVFPAEKVTRALPIIGNPLRNIPPLCLGNTGQKPIPPPGNQIPGA